jgi:hypothetical protein
MPKTIEQNFADWEGNAFGFGYGTGEPHTLRALKSFFDALGTRNGDHCYEYEKLEEALTAPVAWLLINVLCRHGVDVIEYGTSPRYGWLTAEGIALRDFIKDRTVGELVDICCGRTQDDDVCYPDACNCGPGGYQEGVKCQNPFWPGHHP